MPLFSRNRSVQPPGGFPARPQSLQATSCAERSSTRRGCLHQHTASCERCPSKNLTPWMRRRYQLHLINLRIKRMSRVAYAKIIEKLSNRLCRRTDSSGRNFSEEGSTERLNHFQRSGPEANATTYADAVANEFFLQGPPKTSARTSQFHNKRLTQRRGGHRNRANPPTSPRLRNIPSFVQQLGWHRPGSPLPAKEPENRMTKLGFFDHVQCPTIHRYDGPDAPPRYTLVSELGSSAVGPGIASLYGVQDQAQLRHAIQRATLRPVLPLKLSHPKVAAKHHHVDSHGNVEEIKKYHTELGAKIRLQKQCHIPRSGADNVLDAEHILGLHRQKSRGPEGDALFGSREG